MKEVIKVQIIISIMVVIIPGFVFGQIPQLINYQGILVDPITGDPVADASYEMVFSIYDVASGGSAIWTETKNVQTQNGLYSVLLGSTTPLTATILSGTEKYLGIKVGTDTEMTPRKRIVSVAYAIVSDNAYSLGGKVAIEYPTKSELSISDGDPPNHGSNLVNWDNLTEVPPGFADGVDDVGTGSGGWIDDGAVVRLETGTDNVGIGTSDPDGNKLNVVGGSSTAIGASSSGSNAIHAYANSGGGFAAGNFTASGEGTYGVWVQSSDYDALYAHSGTGYAINAFSDGGTAIRSNGIVHSTAGGFKFPDGTTQTTASTAGTPAWYLTGNGGTTPGTNFLGTTDNKALELKVRNFRALRLEPNETSPNLVGGFNGNNVTPGIYGATIGGGGQGGNVNSITGSFSTVAGGEGNSASSDRAFVGGGQDNTASSSFTTVGGGWVNNANGPYNIVGGGSNNTANGQYAFIGGGSGNTTNGNGPTLAGGTDNTINADNATIAGGLGNEVTADFGIIAGGGRSDPYDPNTRNKVTDEYGTIGGGGNNLAGNENGDQDDAQYATVSGGTGNAARSYASTVAGGSYNTADGDSGWATVSG